MERPKYYLDPPRPSGAQVEEVITIPWSPSAEYLLGYLPQEKKMRLGDGTEITMEINPRLDAPGTKVEYRPKLAIPGNGTLHAATKILGEHAMRWDVMRRVTDGSSIEAIQTVVDRVVDMAVVPTKELNGINVEDLTLSRLAKCAGKKNTHYTLVARGSVAEK